MEEYVLTEFLKDNNIQPGDCLSVKVNELDKNSRLNYDGKFSKYVSIAEGDGILILKNVNNSDKSKYFFHRDINHICPYEEQFEPDIGIN